jgi:hypothetical protein
MSKFTVKIEGRNFLGRHTATQKNKKYGFITIVLAEAKDEFEAEQVAVALLKSDEDLRDFPKNDDTDPPLLNIEEITEVREWPNIAHPRSGLVWFPEE